MKITSYGIITVALHRNAATSNKEMVDKIIDHMRDGWQPLGGVYAAIFPPQHLDHNGAPLVGMYLQTIVKYGE